MLRYKNYLIVFFILFNIIFCIKFKQNPLDPSTPLGYYLSYLLDDDTNVILDDDTNVILNDDTNIISNNDTNVISNDDTNVISNNDNNVNNQNTVDRKKVFVTYNQYWGNLGGISGADTKCNEDPLKPPSGIYKAMIVLTGVRVACNTPNCLSGGAGENLNWVFEPNTSYYRSDGTYLFTTNAAGIVTSLVNSLSDTSSQLWTGLNSSWQVYNTCGSWDSNALNLYGSIGYTDLIVSGNTAICTYPFKIVCVEQ